MSSKLLIPEGRSSSSLCIVTYAVPIMPTTPCGQRFYFLNNNASRYLWVVLHMTKVVIANAIKRIQAIVEERLQAPSSTHRVIDNTNEFTAVEFTEYCANEGIQRR